MARRYRPGDVVRLTHEDWPSPEREGLVLRVYRDLPNGVRLALDLIDVAFGEELVNTTARCLTLVRAADEQQALPLPAD